VAFFPEEIFSTLLSLERKRSERSGYPFGLALLDVSEIDASSLPLSDYLRETDVMGWYREHSILGIMFNTLNGTPVSVIRTTLTSKIREMVQDNIPFKLMIFPEDVTLEVYPESHLSKPGVSFHTIKRVIDVAGSLGAIMLLSPVFFVVAGLVKLSSPGPVFFRQKRLGLLGKQFDFVKFRTMYVDNDPSIHKEYVAKLIEGRQKSSGVYKIQKDPRVTAIGRFLRKSSLDELPQFLNVLKGEMSLVGPRPPIPYEMEKYRTWHKRRVLEVKPGLTGLWQVMGRSRTTFDEMVRLDIRYIQEQSAWLDFKILLQTPGAIISGTGAY
jgi:lipopolysaccharide/colanic/teichoic acid biosynthesis glycosyltransferase